MSVDIVGEDEGLALEMIGDTVGLFVQLTGADDGTLLVISTVALMLGDEESKLLADPPPHAQHASFPVFPKFWFDLPYNEHRFNAVYYAQS